MKKTTIVAVVLLLLIVAPVIVKQVLPAEGRSFTGTSLDETDYEEVVFRNAEQGIDMAGMLFVPSGDGPFPAAVVIHGSGTSNRANRWYLTLVKHLQDSGVAVLLPDKRGSEKSGGDWRSASFEDLATDTIAALEFMENQDRVPLAVTGIIGMSQGGWIAPIVADRVDVEFVVSVVGSVVTPDEQLLFEEDYNLRQMGFLPGISYLVALVSTTIIKGGAQKEFWDAVRDYDPAPKWQKLDVDALALFGREDTNVPSEESAKRLESLRNERIRIRVFDGSGHALESPPGQGDSIIRQDALDAVSSFILSVRERGDQ